MSSLKEICEGLPLDPLPPRRPRDESVPHAPVRTPDLSPAEQRLALENSLRYFPSNLHETLAPEFAEELQNYGHIYMYRFLPQIQMRAFPIGEIPARNRHAAAIIHMILNNLDPHVAQFPQELVTYGGNGQVLSNWAQFWLLMKYLSEMADDQTLVMNSGHPLGLFPSSTSAPRLVITNGMVVPNYSSREDYEKMFALGVTMYGQMTAGSYCYIGPQGIVHGTTNRQEIEDFIKTKSPAEIRVAVFSFKGWIDGAISEGKKIVEAGDLFNDDLEPIPELENAAELLKTHVSPLVDNLPPLPEDKQLVFLHKCIETAEATDFDAMDSDKERLTEFTRQVFNCAETGLSLISHVLDLTDVSDADLTVSGLADRLELIEATSLEMGHLGAFLLGVIKQIENGVDVDDIDLGRRTAASPKDELMAVIAKADPEEIRKVADEIGDTLGDAIKVIDKMIDLGGALGDDLQPTAEFKKLEKQLNTDEKKEKELMDKLPALANDKETLFLGECKEVAKNTNFDAYSKPKDFLNEVFRQVLVCGVTGLEVLQELVDIADMDDADLNTAGLADRVSAVEQAVIEMGHLKKWGDEFVKRAMSVGLNGNANDLVDLKDRAFGGKKPKSTGSPPMRTGEPDGFTDKHRFKPTGEPKRTGEPDGFTDKRRFKPTGGPKRTGEPDGFKPTGEPKRTGEPDGFTDKRRFKPTGGPKRTGEPDGFTDKRRFKPTGGPKRTGEPDGFKPTGGPKRTGEPDGFTDKRRFKPTGGPKRTGEPDGFTDKRRFKPTGGPKRTGEPDGFKPTGGPKRTGEPDGFTDKRRFKPTGEPKRTGEPDGFTDKRRFKPTGGPKRNGKPDGFKPTGGPKRTGGQKM